MTAEVGPKPFQTFRAAYEKKFGADRIGVGDVVQPPDWAMYSYDTVNLVAKALTVAKALGQPLVDALNTVSVTGANGDERSFLPRNHEGVSSDDMYIARFGPDLRYAPVKDDQLSASLPVVPQ
jgi:ABC-type branched-subunit amino acid transport system substrate-binding protein